MPTEKKNKIKMLPYLTFIPGTLLEHRGRVVNIPACIIDVLGSDLYPETHYPKLGISYIFAVPPGKLWDSTLNERDTR
jgi:hypothetical protein